MNIKAKRRKSISYICECCFNKVDVDLDYDLSTECKGNNFKLVSDIQLVPTEMICTNCQEFMFECDPLLADIIVAANKDYGLKTNFCCEGHVYEYNDGTFAFAAPYISFQMSEAEEVLKIINFIADFGYSGKIIFGSFDMSDKSFVIISKMNLDFDEMDQETLHKAYEELKESQKTMVEFMHDLFNNCTWNLI